MYSVTFHHHRFVVFWYFSHLSLVGKRNNPFISSHWDLRWRSDPHYGPHESAPMVVCAWSVARSVSQWHGYISGMWTTFCTGLLVVVLESGCYLHPYIIIITWSLQGKLRLHTTTTQMEAWFKCTWAGNKSQFVDM